MSVDRLSHQAATLFQAGRFEEAAAIYREVLRREPAHFGALYALGVMAAQEMRTEEAERLIGQALGRNPHFPEGWCMRGRLQAQLGRMGEALASFDRASALSPGSLEALSGRAEVLVRANRPAEALECLDRLVQAEPHRMSHWNYRGAALMGLRRFEDALTSFDTALSIDPAHAGSWSNRGASLIALDRFAEAAESYDRVLALDPALPEAEATREFVRFKMKEGTRCPPDYMRKLFDEFSAHYDTTMLETLSYRGHQHVRAMIDRVLPHPARPLRILDLGPGTGLTGEAVKDLAAGGRLDGIDIAPRMIEKARARGLYDDLVLGDIETVLAQPGPRYDLVIAADTMIYFGDLGPTLSGVAARLEPGGFYVLAVETKEGEGWEQTDANRFRHSQSYIMAAAAQAGLALRDIFPCMLRRHGAEMAAGFAVALEKPAAAPLSPAASSSGN
jgi:predicted TPR repeat methyltransferase